MFQGTFGKINWKNLGEIMLQSARSSCNVKKNSTGSCRCERAALYVDTFSAVYVREVGKMPLYPVFFC